MLGNKNVVNFIFFFRKCAMNPDREIVPEVRPEAEPTEPSSLTEMLSALVSRTAPVPSLVIRLPSRMSVSTILRRVRAGPGSRRSLL